MPTFWVRACDKRHLNFRKGANAFFAVALDLTVLDGRLKHLTKRDIAAILKRRFKTRFDT